MPEEITTSLKGHFLMAMPGLGDPNFSKTVTCICEHTPAGALGVVINRVHISLVAKSIYGELEITAGEAASQIAIHIGGPVHTNELFILHGPPFDWAGCLMVTDSLAMSNTRDVLEAIAAGQGPQQYTLAMGCAGWGPGQLEAEVKANAWLTSIVSESIIFEVPAEEQWEAAVRGIGIDPSILTQTAGHA